MEVNRDGTFTVITDGLDRPTSLEFIGNTAYVVTLTGEVWKIKGVSKQTDHREDCDDDDHRGHGHGDDD